MNILKPLHGHITPTPRSKNLSLPTLFGSHMVLPSCLLHERERETLLSRILWWVQSMHPHVYAWSWAPGHSTHAYMAHTVITINNTNQKSTVRPEDSLLLLTCSRLHLHYPLYTQLQQCPGHLFSFISCTEEDGEENWTETKKNHYSHDHQAVVLCAQWGEKGCRNVVADWWDLWSCTNKGPCCSAHNSCRTAAFLGCAHTIPIVSCRN